MVDSLLFSGCSVDAVVPPRQTFFAVCFNTLIGNIVIDDGSSSVDKRPASFAIS